MGRFIVFEVHCRGLEAVGQTWGKATALSRQRIQRVC